MSSLKAKLFAAASIFPALTTLLTAPDNTFAWWDTQLDQNSAFPAVVVTQVSRPRDYATTSQLPTSWSRMQFTVYGTGNDSQNADAVVSALESFFSTFNAIGIPNLTTYPNLIVGDRDFGMAQTTPMTYQRILDVRIFSNELL